LLSALAALAVAFAASCGKSGSDGSASGAGSADASGVATPAVSSARAAASPLSAMDACTKLEAAGVAGQCKAATPTGLGIHASEAVAFDLPSLQGHGGAVFRFDSADDYDKTVKMFAAASLAGPHRYGNRDRLIFTQFNSEASADVGAKAKAAIDAL
jgi:hypothetical protein